jgi:beta-lactamase superfamily II metal-dependent hydrolase
MAYEIDYIPVGEGEKGGDAIALRFGNLTGPRTEQTVIVIDGGTKESGETLVNHIKTYYGTEIVDVVFCTHPDADHASGLTVVLEKLNVTTLAMHKPWDHAEDIKRHFVNGRITSSGLSDKFEKALQHASDLEVIAKKKGVQIVEPFQGVTGFNGALHVLGPSREYYQGLLAHFRSTPEPVAALGFLAPAVKAIETVARKIQDFIHIDLLDDDTDSTSAENNSSAIVFFNIDGHKILFTGDAGKTALHLAADYADTKGIVLTGLNLLDVPHHGSKRNMSSKVLKRINGVTASISAPQNSDKHPSKKVINGLKKYGALVYVTKNMTLCHPHLAPTREGWGPAPQEPFYDYVEE